MEDMKFITDYSEFGGEGESFKNNISPLGIEEKKKVLEYLKNGKKESLRCSSIYDYVKEILTSMCVYCYTDGTYNWADDEIYHFEHYDIELNHDFVSMVLNK